MTDLRYSSGHQQLRPGTQVVHATLAAFQVSLPGREATKGLPGDGMPPALRNLG